MKRRLGQSLLKALLKVFAQSFYFAQSLCSMFWSAGNYKFQIRVSHFVTICFVSLAFPIILFINMLNHDLHSYGQRLCAKSLGKDFEQGFKTLRKVFAQEMCSFAYS